jgi:hypothetical protein
MPESPFEFDVFLSHNSKDKPAVERIAQILRDEYRLKPWLDKWQLTPGKPWQEELEDGLKKSETVAVFLGDVGLGKWENEEMRVAVDARVSDPKTRVIPVLLPGAPDSRDMSIFLKRYTWVDLRKGFDARELLYELFCGIKGIAPGDRAVPSHSPASDQPVQRLREQMASIPQAESKRRSVPRQSAKLPTEEDLRITRYQFAELNKSQRELKDFVDGYIMFSEPWIDCGLAKSKLEDGKKRLDARRKDASKDVPDEEYWNDIKKHLKRARTKLSGDVPNSLRATGRFDDFNEALSKVLKSVELFTTGKMKKIDIISESLEYMDDAVNAAEMIVDNLQDAAQKKLENISGLITGIFGPRPEISEAVSPSQVSYRSIDRSQISQSEEGRALSSKPHQ